MVYCRNDINFNNRFNMGLAEIIIGFYVCGVAWLVYEALNAPTMPDDYDKEYPN